MPRASNEVGLDTTEAESKSKKKGRKKYKSFAEAQAALAKTHGDALFDNSEARPIPTRFWRLGMFLGGGLPEGRVIELWGPPGGWKTTEGLVMVGDIQADAQDRHPFYVDFEQTFPEAYAARHGAMLDERHVCRPRFLDQGYDAALTMIETGEVSVVMVDSVVSIASKKQVDAESVEKDLMADRARILTKFLYEATPLCRENKCTLILVNQMRDNLNAGMFGNPEKRSGGRTLEHLASVICRCSATKDGAKMSIVKNKITGRAKRDFIYGATDGEGLDLSQEFLAYLVMLGVVKQSGAHYKFGKKSVHGKTEAAAYANDRQLELLHVAQEEYKKLKDVWTLDSNNADEDGEACESE